MTDNEIIKALECCVSYEFTCLNCPYCEDKHYTEENGFELMPNGKYYDDLSCDEWLKIDVFALVNRQRADIEWAKERILKADKTVVEQKAETERLKEHYSKCGERTTKTILNLQETLGTARAEAVKEFIGKLKRSLINVPQKDINYSNLVEHIDNLYKEKVGD